MGHFSGDAGLVGVLSDPSQDPFCQLAQTWLHVPLEQVTRALYSHPLCSSMCSSMCMLVSWKIMLLPTRRYALQLQKWYAFLYIHAAARAGDPGW